ncbi:MAG: ATP-binding protein [Chloroflexota bacterium]|nr:response regulator [Chloroflexota bacterium]
MVEEITSQNNFSQANKVALSSLIKSVTKISSILELETLLEQITTVLREVLETDGSVISLLDKAKPHSKMKVYLAKLAGFTDKGSTIRQGYALTGQIWQTGEARILDKTEYAKIPDHYDYHQEGFEIESIMGAPLKEGDKIIGVLCAIRTNPQRPFTTTEFEIFCFFASNIGIAIANAQLYEEQQKLVQELTRKTMEQEAVIEQVADGLIMLYPNGTIRQISYPARKLLFPHFAPSQALVDQKLEVLLKQSLPLQQIIESGKNTGETTLNIITSERSHVVTLSILILRNATSQAVETILIILHNKTEQFKAQTEAAQLERLRLMGQLASGVAHDLNNLLAGIVGGLDVLHDDLITLQGLEPTPEVTPTKIKLKRVLESLDFVQKVALDSTEIVQRIYRTRLNRSTDTEPVSLVEIVNQAVDLLKPRWQSQASLHGVDYKIKLEIEAELKAMATRSELQEVMVNLLSNALDAMPTGGRIAISGTQSENWVELKVSDTGKGISEELRDKIFRPFFTTKGERGTGLGLAVSQELIEKFGGTIQVKSTLGIGTSFIIRLPLVIPIAIKAATSQTSGTERGNKTEAGLLPVHQRILAFDDDLTLCRIIKTVLTNAGHTVSTFSNPVDGIAFFEENLWNFDLLLTDMTMPHMTGKEVIEKAHLLRPELPVILISGWGEELKASLGENYHINYFLSKPYTADGLKKAVIETMAQVAH